MSGASSTGLEHACGARRAERRNRLERGRVDGIEIKPRREEECSGGRRTGGRAERGRGQLRPRTVTALSGDDSGERDEQQRGGSGGV
ncbi:MAG: hypothetical protein EXR73_02015 [Myxococcales bacterium]|nr:hypothetical protein [Myxococcales bacterium]